MATVSGGLEQMTHHCKTCGKELTNIPASCTFENWECQPCYQRNVRFERPMMNNSRLLPPSMNDGFINHERYGKSRKIA